MKKESAKNVFWSVAASASNILITLFAQRIFLSILDTEYLGLNGLFSNIISMLGIFELGVGTAIIFSLYRPLARGNLDEVKSLMKFYRRAYGIIATVVAVVGLSITPIIPNLIKETSIDINIYVIYCLFLADVVFSYLLSYRRSILYADRKNYTINIIHIAYLLVMNTAQLCILAATKNYYIYLTIKVVMRVIENYSIHLLVRKTYPYLNNLKDAHLDKKAEKKIMKSVRALFLHKIGGFIVLGSDNIIISKFIGLVEVGLYSNYYIIINATYTVVGQALSSLTPSVGHLLATKESTKTYETFRKTRFAVFLISCLVSAGFFVAVQPFVTLWLGENYTLSTFVVAILAINMFQRLQRYAYSVFKEAAGIFREDRFVPIVESIVNIVASVIFLNIFGLAGVFIGTVLSDLVLWIFSYPRFVYKKLFGRSYVNYFTETIGFFVLFSIITVISSAASMLFCQLPTASRLACSIFTTIIIFSSIIIIVFQKNDNFMYYKRMFKSKIVRKR